MDICQKAPIAGEYGVLTPSPCSLDDLFTGQTMECDVSLEWLSTLVEDSLYSSGHKLPPTPPTPDRTGNNAESEESISKGLEESQRRAQEKPISLQSYILAPVGESRKRTKRKRAKLAKNPLASWSHQLNPNGCFTNCYADPPLLQQEHWLADSELIVPKAEQEEAAGGREEKKEYGYQYGPSEGVPHSECEGQKRKKDEGFNERSPLLGVGVQIRRCSHCMAHKTPQWRAGPLGPKTLCNACGVRYKSGRLLPEYRPAKSPTFVSLLHSNSHKRVLEMRMGVEDSSVSGAEK